MRKLILVASMIAFLGCLSAAASAQQRAPSPSPSQPGQMPMMDGMKMMEGMNMNMNKVLAIGAGVVVGAVVLEALAVGDAMVLVGGVAGGLIGAWWYDNSGDPMSRTAIRPTAMTIAFAPGGEGPSF
jgi:hypothetical protein